jgi:hypothetical protein
MQGCERPRASLQQKTGVIHSFGLELSSALVSTRYKHQLTSPVTTFTAHLPACPCHLRDNCATGPFATYFRREFSPHRRLRFTESSLLELVQVPTTTTRRILFQQCKEFFHLYSIEMPQSYLFLSGS